MSTGHNHHCSSDHVGYALLALDVAVDAGPRPVDPADCTDVCFIERGLRGLFAAGRTQIGPSASVVGQGPGCTGRVCVSGGGIGFGGGPSLCFILATAVLSHVTNFATFLICWPHTLVIPLGSLLSWLWLLRVRTRLAVGCLLVLLPGDALGSPSLASVCNLRASVSSSSNEKICMHVTFCWIVTESRTNRKSQRLRCGDCVGHLRKESPLLRHKLRCRYSLDCEL